MEELRRIGYNEPERKLNERIYGCASVCDIVNNFEFWIFPELLSTVSIILCSYLFLGSKIEYSLSTENRIKQTAIATWHDF